MSKKTLANKNFLELLVKEVISENDNSIYNLINQPHLLNEWNFVNPDGTPDTSGIMRFNAMKFRGNPDSGFTEEEIEVIEKGADAYDEGQGLAAVALATIFGLALAGKAAAGSTMAKSALSSAAGRSITSRAGNSVLNFVSKFKPPPTVGPGTMPLGPGGVRIFGKQILGPAWTSWETAFGLKLLGAGMTLIHSKQVAEEADLILTHCFNLGLSLKQRIQRNYIYGEPSLLAAEKIKIDNTTHEIIIKSFISLYSEWNPANISIDGDDSDLDENYTGWSVSNNIVNLLSNQAVFNSFYETLSTGKVQKAYTSLWTEIFNVSKQGSLGLGGSPKYLLINQNQLKDLINKIISEKVYFNPQAFCFLCFKFAYNQAMRGSSRSAQNIQQTFIDMNIGLDPLTLESTEDGSLSLKASKLKTTSSVASIFREMKNEMGEELASNKGLREDFYAFVTLTRLDPAGDLLDMEKAKNCLHLLKKGSIDKINSEGRDPKLYRTIIAGLIFHLPEELLTMKGIDVAMGKISKVRGRPIVKNPSLSALLTAGFWLSLGFIDPFNKVDRKKIIDIFQDCIKKAEKYKKIQIKRAKNLNESVLLLDPMLLNERPEPMFGGDFPMGGGPVASNKEPADNSNINISEEDLQWEFTEEQVRDVLNTFYESFTELGNEIKQVVNQTWAWKTAMEKVKDKEKENALCISLFQRKEIYQGYLNLQLQILNQFEELATADLSGAINSENYEAFIASMKSVHKKVLENFEINKIADISFQLGDLNENKKKLLEIGNMFNQALDAGPGDLIFDHLSKVSNALREDGKESNIKTADKIDELLNKWPKDQFNAIVKNFKLTGDDPKIKKSKVESFISNSLSKQNQEQIKNSMKSNFISFRKDVKDALTWKNEFWNDASDLRHGAILNANMTKSRLFSGLGGGTVNIVGVAKPFGFDNWILHSNCWGTFVRDLGSMVTTKYSSLLSRQILFDPFGFSSPEQDEWRVAHDDSSLKQNKIRAISNYSKKRIPIFIDTDDLSGYYSEIVKSIKQLPNNYTQTDSGLMNLQISDLLNKLDVKKMLPGHTDDSGIDDYIIENKDSLVNMLKTAGVLEKLHLEMVSHMMGAKVDMAVLNKQPKRVEQSKITQLYKKNNTSFTKNEGQAYKQPSKAKQISTQHYKQNRQLLIKEQQTISNYLYHIYCIIQIDKFLIRQLG